MVWTETMLFLLQREPALHPDSLLKLRTWQMNCYGCKHYKDLNKLRILHQSNQKNNWNLNLTYGKMEIDWNLFLNNLIVSGILRPIQRDRIWTGREEEYTIDRLHKPMKHWSSTFQIFCKIMQMRYRVCGHTLGKISCHCLIH